MCVCVGWGGGGGGGVCRVPVEGASRLCGTSCGTRPCNGFICFLVVGSDSIVLAKKKWGMKWLLYPLTHLLRLFYEMP